VDVVITADHSAAILAAIHAACRRAEDEGADRIAKRAQDKIRTGIKSGRRYSRKGASWTASAPGEAPADVTHALVEGIKARRAEDGQGAEAASTDFIAHTMEFGTAGGKVAPRPYLTPSAEEDGDTFPLDVADIVRFATSG
jgi:hypothetical protein